MSHSGLSSRITRQGMKGKQGYTLVESALILGIFVVLISGVWSLYNSTAEKQKVARMAEASIQMVEDIRRFVDMRQYPTVVGTTTDLNHVMRTAGYIPSDLIRADRLRTPWDGRLSLSLSYYGVKKRISISLQGRQLDTAHGLTGAQCTALMRQMISRLGTRNDLERIYTEKSGVGANYYPPYDIASIACPDPFSTLQFIFYPMEK